MILRKFVFRPPHVFIHQQRESMKSVYSSRLSIV